MVNNLILLKSIILILYGFVKINLILRIKYGSIVRHAKMS